MVRDIESNVVLEGGIIGCGIVYYRKTSSPEIAANGLEKWWS